MKKHPSIFNEFKKWCGNLESEYFEKLDFGIADQDIENISWLNIDTKHTISNITLWDTGDYFLTINTIFQDTPVFSRRGAVSEASEFQNSFEDFFKEIESLEDKHHDKMGSLK